MHLSPHEQEGLLPSYAAEPARRRQARELKLDLPEAAAWLPPVALRAYASTVHIDVDEAEVMTGEDAARLPLPGGWVATAGGSELHRVVRGAAALTTDLPLRVPA